MSGRKRWFRRPLWLIVLLAFGVYVVPRLWTTVRFAGQVHGSSLDEDFTRIKALLPPSDNEISLFYRGLPHNYFEKPEFIRAVWLSPTRSHHGYRFQFPAWEPSSEFRAAVQTALTRTDSFDQYASKMCGGFHADFLAEFKTSEGKVRFMVCLGCGDVLVFSPQGSAVVGLSRDADDALQKAWRQETGE